MIFRHADAVSKTFGITTVIIDVYETMLEKNALKTFPI